MTPRRLDQLLHAASRNPPADCAGGRAAVVRQYIRQGWDPERIEWQRWLRRWWPRVIAVVLGAAVCIARMPHAKHDASNPPPLGLFGQHHVSPPPNVLP